MSSYYSIEGMSDEEIIEEIRQCKGEIDQATEKVKELIDGLANMGKLYDLKSELDGAGVFVNDDDSWGFVEYTIGCSKNKE